jgi:hypothetical protein
MLQYPDLLTKYEVLILPRSNLGGFRPTKSAFPSEFRGDSNPLIFSSIRHELGELRVSYQNVSKISKFLCGTFSTANSCKQKQLKLRVQHNYRAMKYSKHLLLTIFQSLLLHQSLLETSQQFRCNVC